MVLEALAVGLIGAERAQAAPPYPEAVLLVSGFETETPFTSPDPFCDGKEGSEWNPPGGIASALKAAGNDVFTAPVGRDDKPLPPSCTGPGEPLPTAAMQVVSNGPTDPNGAALASLIGFLRDSYGVERLHLVAHSDGGLWSRAGITQDSPYAGVEIQSLTTLGTPHTGSFIADLGIELDNGKCDFSNRVEQLICDAMLDVIELVVTELGPTASRQLTNDFLATWNPQQVLGSCPVSVIAGDHVGFDLPLLEYYTPSDGLVGLASAQAQRALDVDGHTIPAPEIADLRKAGVFDVVHGGSLSFLSKKNLLNQPQISDRVTDETLLSGAQSCNVGSDGIEPEPSVQRLRAPLYRMVAADRRGRLPVPGAEDVVATAKRVSVRCGFNRVEPVPLFGDRRLRLHSVGDCEERPRLNSGAGGRADGLLLRSHPRRHAFLRVEGDEVRVRVRGRDPRRINVSYAGESSGSSDLDLDRKGRATLPDAGGDSFGELRVRAKGRSQAPADTASLVLAR